MTDRGGHSRELCRPVGRLPVNRNQRGADRQILSDIRQELQQAVVLLSKLHQPPTIDPENDTKLASTAVVPFRFQPDDSWVLIQLRCWGLR